MVYAYDLWAQLPVKDLYDSLMMATAIAAAKDMYDRGQEQVKLFRKDYGDFISPFAKDMLAYGEMVNGVRGLINESLANGIDLFKSPEGRALISRAVNSVDPGVYNQMRANAKIGYEYQSALQKLAAAGKFDKDMNDAWLLSQGMGPFDEFSTVDPKTGSTRTWGVSSPIEAISLRDLTSPGFAHRTAHELTKEQALRELGASYDPRKTYSGWVYDDLFDTAGKLVPGLRGDWRGQYFRNISARKALELNPNATEADIDRLYQEDIAEANRLWLILPIGNLNDWYKQQDLHLKTVANNIRAARLNAQKDEQEKDAIGWTKRQKTAIMLNYTNNSKSLPKGGWTPSKFYGLFQTIPQGADKTTAVALAAGISNPEQIDVGINSKRMPVMFGSNDLSITPKRQREYYDAIAANPKLKYNFGFVSSKNFEEDINRSIVNDFDIYLKRNHILGYIPSTDVSVNYTTNNENDVFDINVYSRVNKSDLDLYFKTDEAFINKGEILGLVAVLKKNGRRVAVTGKNKNSLVWDNIEYVDIPITRTIESVGYGNSVIDTFHDMSLGKSTASKRQRTYETEDELDLFED